MKNWDINSFKVTNNNFKLADYQERLLDEEEDQVVKDKLYQNDVEVMQEWHKKLHADEEQGILVALQALDAAGKDELIQYIFSTLLPQGIKVTSFKKPSDEEEKHDYLWRIHEGLPERGQLAILNRSYYEDIITPQIKDSLADSPLPDSIKNDPDLLNKRYTHIKNFEKYLVENGFPVIKFFFHMSKDKQSERFLERLKNPEHNFEFSFSDIDDRADWDQYQEVFEQMIANTATEVAPWYILPADNPGLTWYIATQVIIDCLEKINPKYPTFSNEDQDQVDQLIKELEQGQV